MKIYNTFNALVLSTVSTPSKDGQNTYYKASIMDLVSKEAGSISCTKEVAEMIVPMTQYQCTAVYDNTYSPASFRITMVNMLPDQPLLQTAASNLGQDKPSGAGTPKK